MAGSCAVTWSRSMHTIFQQQRGFVFVYIRATAPRALSKQRMLGMKHEIEREWQRERDFLPRFFLLFFSIFFFNPRESQTDSAGQTQCYTMVQNEISYSIVFLYQMRAIFFVTSKANSTIRLIWLMLQILQIDERIPRVQMKCLCFWLSNLEPYDARSSSSCISTRSPSTSLASPKISSNFMP